MTHSSNPQEPKAVLISNKNSHKPISLTNQITIPNLLKIYSKTKTTALKKYSLIKPLTPTNLKSVTSLSNCTQITGLKSKFQKIKFYKDSFKI